MDPRPVLSGLVQRGVPVHIAQGIVANMMAESRLDTGINEIAPLVPGSRGGYGLNQWTGPRRVQYERFAEARGVDPSDLDAQLDFTLWELQNTERGAWEALNGAQSATDAARIYSDKFLRPGIPHMDRRLAYAKQIANEVPTPNALAMADRSQQMNALAAAMPRYEQPKLNAFRIERV